MFSHVTSRWTPRAFRAFLSKWKEVPAAQVSCGPAFTHTELKPTWLSTSSNHGGGHQPSMGGSSTDYGGGISQVWGGHQPTMGGAISQVWGCHQPTMGGHQPSMEGGGIFPPVCTGSQNPQNYFSNTYVLPSVNRTAGPMTKYDLDVCSKRGINLLFSPGLTLVFMESVIYFTLFTFCFQF